MADIKTQDGNLVSQEESKTLPARSTDPIKFKDKAGRGGILFDLKKTFGFLPEKVHFQKVHGANNTFIVSALLTESELKREAKEAKDAKPKLVSKKLKLKKKK